MQVPDPPTTASPVDTIAATAGATPSAPTNSNPLPAPSGAPRSQAGQLSGRTGATAWGDPDSPLYAQQNLVTLNVDGVHVVVNKMIATQMSGFLHDLIRAGYRPKSVQGYNNRAITGGTGKSNHAYGAAIDIDPGDNPRYVGRDGKHKIDSNLANTLAKKWGLFWGGNYKNSKDYMHFEALGAPRTPGSPPGGTEPVITPAAKAAGATVGIEAPYTGATGTSAPGAGIDVLGADGKIDPTKAIAVYGSVAALAQSVPDIQRVIQQALEQGVDPTTAAGAQRFEAMLSNTAWWKKTSDAQRKNEIEKKTNPGEYKRKREQTISYLTSVATDLGVKEGDQRLFIIAERALANGWSTDEMRRYLAADVQVVDGEAGQGRAAVTVDTLKEQAAQYLVPISDQTLQTWTQQVLKGDVPIEAFHSYLKDQAKSLFPALSSAIDSGVTVAQYVQPYREIAAQTLEVNPNEVNFLDPKWSAALFQTGKDGTRTAMSLADWQMTLRKRPEYERTRGAQQQAASLVTTLASELGRVA